MLSLKNILLSCPLLLALGLSIWLVFRTYPLDTHTISVSPTVPDAYVEEVVATILNKAGTPALRISAPRMVHYPAADTTNIQAPRITVFRQSPEPWYINADYAQATQGISKVYFWNNVAISHARDTQNQATTIHTATLTVFPDQQIASTADAVTFEQPDTTINATGMLANLNNGTVKLLSNARGEYAPHS